MQHHHTHTHGDRILMDEIAYASSLRMVSPALKLLFVVYTLLVCLIAKAPLLSLLILCSMLFCMVKLGGVQWHRVVHLLCIPLAFLVVGCLMILLQITQKAQPFLWSVSFGSWYLGVTTASLRQAGVLFIQCLAAVSCLYFLSTTTPMTELFTTMRRLHIPSFLVEIMELVYRYIFVLLQIAAQIRHAQVCRLGYRNLKTSFYSTGQLIANLFIRSYRQAERTYIAMESRGYTGDIRTLGIAYETKPWQRIGAIGYLCLITVLAIWMRWKGICI